MSRPMVKDVILLALCKKDLNQKISYFFKGIVFLPLLIRETKKTDKKGDMSASASAAGEDIYPLF